MSKEFNKKVFAKDRDMYYLKNYSLSSCMNLRRGSLHTDKLSKYIYQPLSNFCLWIFLNLNISANGVGLVMVVMSLFASFLYFFGSKVSIFAASFLFFMAMVLDHTDGDVARITKKFSKKGIYLDHIHHMLEEFFTFIGLGFFNYIIFGQIEFLLLGFFISFVMVFSSYLKNTILWFVEKDGYYDSKFRKLPLVIFYGDFFKWWHPLIMIFVIFDISHILLYIAFIWSVFRIIPKMYVLWKECELYDEGKK